MVLPLGYAESPETARSLKKSLQASRSVDKDSRVGTSCMGTYIVPLLPN